MINIGIIGINGKMGRQIREVISQYPQVEIRYGYARSAIDDKVQIFTNLEPLFQKSDIVLDFSTPKVLQECLEINTKHLKPFISGTTGISQGQFNMLQELGGKTKVCWSANMSYGIAVMQKLLHLATKLLPNSEVEILETHHNQKQDAPSGTALLLGKEIAKVRKLNLEEVMKVGARGKRTLQEIGFAIRRGGQVIGEHSATFFFGSETLEISHTAQSRAVFAHGALEAVVKLYNLPQKAGFFTLYDLLELEFTTSV